ncbi:MAG: tRNA-dihydrouridine synthase family protein [Gammaproteobacteria bacterium]|jgi:tRNA-dihydrouridine synthase B
MIQTLTIKDKTFTSNIVQGPLAGVSCAPFRALTLTWGKPAFSYTEMISCYTLTHTNIQRQQRFIQKVPGETLCFQLSANHPKELGLATKIVTDYGADLVDLNCGCPVKKIRSKKSGSFLLSDAGKIYQLIRAMKENTNCPVSIKIRVDANSDDNFNQEIANAVNDAGADFITVHGRHWTQGYDVNCSYNDIQFFANALNIPVMGNGDVACLASLKKMLATGCAGVMIGRAGVGQPWLIQQLIAEFNHLPYSIPDNKIIGELFIEHILGLSELLKNEKFAVLQARTFAKYYARRIAQKQEFCAAFMECESILQAQEIIKHYF